MVFIRGLLVVAAFAACPARASEPCLRATHAMAAGAVPTAKDFAPAPCDGNKRASAIRYDVALRAARLSRTLQPDEIIPAIPPALMAGVGPGDTLTVQAHVGPVVVQREVEALQAAHPGQKLFVRAADGTVMSVIYPGGAG
jgi:hypothetical protein